MEQRSINAAGSAQLDRALDVLELLARSGGQVGLTEIAAAVGGPKATVHRVMSTLQARGYVSQDRRTAQYAMGIRCFELGSLWAQNLDLRAVAAPHLARLNEVTGETVHLAVYDHGDAVYVDKLESRFPVVAKSYVGRRCAAVAVATGRVLLAFRPTEEIDDVLAVPLPTFTDASIVDPRAIHDLLDEVRRTGYGINHGSYRDGVGGLAAPIRDHTAAVVASVGVCLPEQRFGADRFTMLRDRTVEAAVDISAALGGPATLITSAPAGRRER